MLYAAWVPEPLNPDNKNGCPFTHWLHGDEKPWRVVTADSKEKLGVLERSGKDVEIRPYTGDEPTVPIEEFLSVQIASGFKLVQ